jgi:hypothetical protein
MRKSDELCDAMRDKFSYLPGDVKIHLADVFIQLVMFALLPRNKHQSIQTALQISLSVAVRVTRSIRSRRDALPFRA